MAHTIVDPSKILVVATSGTKATIAANMQAALQTMSAGFVLISFNYIINESNGMVTCITTLETP